MIQKLAHDVNVDPYRWKAVSCTEQNAKTDIRLNLKDQWLIYNVTSKSMLQVQSGSWEIQKLRVIHVVFISDCYLLWQSV